MKSILLILLLLFTFNLFGQNIKKELYKIEIDNWGLLISAGSSWTITNDSIISIRRSIRKDNDTFYYKLLLTESNLIKSYLTRLDFKNLKKNYVDNSAADDMGEFNFKINFRKKKYEFNIYQVKIIQVYELVNEINKYLPKKYHIGYDEKYFIDKK